MTAKSLLVSVFAFFLGMVASAIFLADGYSPGMIGILTMLWLSQMAVLTASLIYVLLCEVRIRPRPQET